MILLIFVLKVRIYVMSSLLRNSPFISQRSELADWQDVVTIVSHHHLTELGHHRQVPAQHLHQSEPVSILNFQILLWRINGLVLVLPLLPGVDPHVHEQDGVALVG